VQADDSVTAGAGAVVAAAAAAAADGSRPGRNVGRRVHPVSIRGNSGGPTADAAWPLPFVESAIKACVGVVLQRRGRAAGVV
jgi:hypothetical protein